MAVTPSSKAAPKKPAKAQGSPTSTTGKSSPSASPKSASQKKDAVAKKDGASPKGGKKTPKDAKEDADKKTPKKGKKEPESPKTSQPKVIMKGKKKYYLAEVVPTDFNVELPKFFREHAEKMWKFLVVPVFASRRSPYPEYIDYTSIQQLACVSKTMRIAVQAYVISRRTEEILRVKESERNLRGELNEFWRARWTRLHDVAEENRRLRFLPTEEAREKARQEELDKGRHLGLSGMRQRVNTDLLPKKGISRDEAKQLLQGVAKLDHSHLGDVARGELVQLKSAFAEFFTAWGKSVEIAPTVGHGEELKKHVFSMANVPAEWGAGEWAKQAIFSLTEKVKKKTREEEEHEERLQKIADAEAQLKEADTHAALIRGQKKGSGGNPGGGGLQASAGKSARQR